MKKSIRCRWMRESACCLESDSTDMIGLGWIPFSFSSVPQKEATISSHLRRFLESIDGEGWEVSKLRGPFDDLMRCRQ